MSSPQSDEDDIHAQLAVHELKWRETQPLLASKGYALRPRLRPGWIPSWKTNGKLYIDCEDHISLPVRFNLVDATRESDGRQVYIKRVRTGDQESTIAMMLNAGHLRGHPDNHSVPVLEIFEDPEDSNISYMVMPFLSRMSDPPFLTVGEVVDFVDQILAGLVFMHEHNVAHRDCSEPNIMMDASAMYPLGVHPVYDVYLPDGITPSSDSMISRSKAGVKYYFVDYGISSHIPSDQPSKLVVGLLGRDRAVPELSDTVPYDPFKVDIFSIGLLFRKEFTKVYSNVAFLEPLINKMMKRSPGDRPTAIEALSQWRDIRRRVSVVARYWRLRPRGEHAIARVVWGTVHVMSSASQATKWVFGKK